MHIQYHNGDIVTTSKAKKAREIEGGVAMCESKAELEKGKNVH